MHRKTVIGALIASTALLSAACTAPPLAEQAPFDVRPVTMKSGEWRVVENVFVVTDGSGSTYADRSFPTAKALSQSFVQALPETSARAANSRYNTGSIGFGGDDRSGNALAQFNRSACAAV